MANTVCALGDTGNLTSRLEKNAIPYEFLQAPTGISPTAICKFSKIAFDNHCDWIITHHFRQLVHAAPSAYLFRRKLIHIEHDYHSYTHRPDILKKFRYFLPIVTKFVGVSEDITAWFQERLPFCANKYITIPNGVDTDRFSPDEYSRALIRRSINVPQDAVVIGTCARMEPVKNLECLIRGFKEALWRLSSESAFSATNIFLIMIGDGSERKYLERLAASLRVHDNCRFSGMVNNTNEWLSAIDIYAMTSKDEGLPLSLMEAMSCGLPVIANDVGSVSNLIDDNVGRLLNSQGTKELTKAIYDFVRNNELRQSCGEMGRKKICNSNSFSHTLESYTKIINS